MVLTALRLGLCRLARCRLALYRLEGREGSGQGLLLRRRKGLTTETRGRMEF